MPNVSQHNAMQTKESHARAICGAKTRSGHPCKNAPMANGRCRMHGGKQPHGIARSNTKHGRYSKYLPGRLLERYQESLVDSELLALREEISIVDARISDLLTRVESGESGENWEAIQKAWQEFREARSTRKTELIAIAEDRLEMAIDAGVTDYTAWTEVRQAIELRRKLVDSERKRLVAAQQMITADEVMLLITAIADTVRRNVSDSDTLSAIQADIDQLITAPVQ